MTPETQALVDELEQYHARLVEALGKPTAETVYRRAADEIRRQDALAKMPMAGSR